jgi:hypothetical protein
MHSMAVDLAETDLTSLLGQEAHSQTGRVRLLQHFQSVSSLEIGSHRMKYVMHNEVGKVAWGNPALMHMVLAVRLSFKPISHSQLTRIAVLRSPAPSTPFTANRSQPSNC